LRTVLGATAEGELRILIADDGDIVRRGIASVLSFEARWQVCGEARDGAETMQKATLLRPDLVLLDVNLPDVSGLEIARFLRAEVPTAKILLVSQHDPTHLLPRAIEAGANGCLDKGCLGAQLLPAIRACLAERG
jgi:DNA-binding NarL/FixJ family response regulator